MDQKMTQNNTMNKLRAKLVLTDKFKDQTIEIEKLKAPIHKEDAKGIPILAGYLKFSYNEGDNSFIEYNVLCEQEVFQDIIEKRLWRQKNIKIKLTFDSKGSVCEFEATPNIKETLAFDFKMHPEDYRDLKRESENLDYTTQSSATIEDCILRILDKPNADGLLVEVKYMPSKVKKQIISEILAAANNALKKKKTIKIRDILADKFLVTDTGNNGEYIYVHPVAF